MSTLFLYFDPRLAARYSERYAEKLASLLERPLAMLTGLDLGKECWFMFRVANTVQSLRRDVFVGSGDLIGPDSCGHAAEITWQEERGAPCCASWTSLPVPDLMACYGNLRPKTVRFRDLPFRIEWGLWWESHLPDFSIEITFVRKPSRSIKQKLETAFANLNPRYLSLRRMGKKICAHVDIGFDTTVRSKLRKLFVGVASVHSACGVASVLVGLDQGGKSNKVTPAGGRR